LALHILIQLKTFFHHAKKQNLHRLL